MQITKVITITLFGVLLSACTSQTQIEGAEGSAALGKTHSHLMPDSTKHVHRHGGDSSSTHSHKLSEVK